jgi:hypothetical protein
MEHVRPPRYLGGLPKTYRELSLLPMAVLPKSKPSRAESDTGNGILLASRSAKMRVNEIRDGQQHCDATVGVKEG